MPEVVEFEVLVGEERTPGRVQRWPPSTFVSEENMVNRLVNLSGKIDGLNNQSENVKFNQLSLSFPMGT